MSTGNAKLSSRYEERQLSGKVKLTLSENLLKQIDYLHDKVGTVEWSGMLVYKILKGSIEDHENMELEAVEVLPMDIGTSAYTEYEISPDSDDYTFDNLSRVLMAPDLKMGHIHTHHNMDCFFSGTDTQELHSNAPNHNYYLSLIVNFKKTENWCAKVVYIGQEYQKGVISSSFKGTSTDITRSINVDKVVDVMFVIDVDIIAESVKSNLDQGFLDRILTLETKKATRFAAPLSKATYRWETPHRVGGWVNPHSKQISLFDEVDEKEVSPFKSKIPRKKLETFLVKLFTVDATSTEKLNDVVESLEFQLGGEEYDETKDAMQDLLIESCIDNYDAIYAECFGIAPNWKDRLELLEEIEFLELDKRYADKEVFQNLLFAVIY